MDWKKDDTPEQLIILQLAREKKKAMAAWDEYLCGYKIELSYRSDGSARVYLIVSKKKKVLWVFSKTVKKEILLAACAPHHKKTTTIKDFLLYAITMINTDEKSKIDEFCGIKQPISNDKKITF